MLGVRSKPGYGLGLSYSGSGMSVLYERVRRNALIPTVCLTQGRESEPLLPCAVKASSRRSTLASWLTEPEDPEPAHPADQDHCTLAPAKVQGVVRKANRIGIRVVSRTELRAVGRIRVPRRHGSRNRRAPGARPARRRGSRRTSAGSRGDPDELADPHDSKRGAQQPAHQKGAGQ